MNDARTICFNAVHACLPDRGVAKVLKDLHIEKDVYLVAAGKAAFAMAKEAVKHVGVKRGIVISKYGHIEGELDHIDTYEAGHPVPDLNGISETEKVIEMCSDLKEDDTVLFLLSGGASSLFESPVISLEKLQQINAEMLKKGLNIFEINAVRKKLSKVKGGRFADLCAPARVCSIILSDVLSDRLDTIGSGPTVKDETDADMALQILADHQIDVGDDVRKIIQNSRVSKAENVVNIVTGSVKVLCQEAMKEAEKLSYRPVLLSDHIDIEAREAGDLLYEKILEHLNDDEDVALIMGGETIVHVKGSGLGGRNQELVFSQMKHIAGLENVIIMSIGSDGTDGPTDAAGGYVDGTSYRKLLEKGGDFEKILNDNDTYHGLKLIDSLIFTGPSGTNVNDLSIALIRK